MLYEATLVADQTPFDTWMETGNLNGTFDANALAGLNLFTGKGDCIACHKGPEFTGASVRNAENGFNPSNAQRPFLNLNPRDSIFTPSGVCSLNP